MDEKIAQYDSLKEVSNEAWEKLSVKIIYFGHQSVGYNILSGVQDIQNDFPQLKLKIVESDDPKEAKTGYFAHSKIGKNKNPLKKINDFKQKIEKGWGEKSNIALLKLCYVDINGETDVEKLFEVYKNEMKVLTKKYPNTTFIHLTVPLSYTKPTFKTWLKKILGKKPWEYAGNMQKNKYNELIEKTYKGKEPIFDIAKIESTLLDGSRSTFKINGKSYYQLAPVYTNDGGHLNKLGRRIVAEKLLLLLVNCCPK